MIVFENYQLMTYLTLFDTVTMQLYFTKATVTELLITLYASTISSNSSFLCAPRSDIPPTAYVIQNPRPTIANAIGNVILGLKIHGASSPVSPSKNPKK
mmetsp:Transcript_4648/g.6046  ORF Transcript_4648/g.6046 Transcript_4648/m.6046 type:complete len:99 (+) Transcript_4648:115-411(+)